MKNSITIVTGLPRSGTSMMMRMLEAGGIEVATDNLRTADTDNPNGYYELEVVKNIKDDTSWVENMKGKAFKMVSTLLYHLPEEYDYNLVFMRRHAQEIMDSQHRMLKRLGKNTNPDDDVKFISLFEKHLNHIDEWIASKTNVSNLYVPYNQLLNTPPELLNAIGQHIDKDLNIEAMCNVIDKNLYRNRSN